LPNPDPIDVFVGGCIRIRRRKLGMTQATLAGRIGVTYQQIQKYETGVNRLAAAGLVRVADALETTVAALLPDGPAVEADDELVAAFARDRDNRPLAVAWNQLDDAQRREVLNLVLGLAQKNAGPRRRSRSDR
jgi:transcriptional regulator with XRE-family HTH domain